MAHFALRTPLRQKLFGPVATLKAADIKPGWRVLDIGPGWGFLAHEASRQVGPEGQLVGVDIEERMLHRCRQSMDAASDPASLACADGSQLPFRSDSFDAALLVSVLGEVRNRSELFAEVIRCLKPGAYAIVNELVLDPDYVFPWTIRNLAGAAGLEVVEGSGNILCHTTKLRKPLVETGYVPAQAQEAEVAGQVYR